MPYKVYGLCVHQLNADGSKGKQVKCHKTPAEAADHVKALYANVKDSERARLVGEALLEREYSTELRKQYAGQGIAMPDGSYPIPDKAALSGAIQAYGRSPDEATKRHITKRARGPGAATMPPEKWSSAAAQTGAKTANTESLRTGYF